MTEESGALRRRDDQPGEPEERRRTGRVSPLYHEVYLALRDRILSGGLPADEALPAEPALADLYRVSRVTIRRTLDQLAAEGLVRRVRGVGTFPCPPDGAADRTKLGGPVDALISIEGATTAVNLSWREVEPEGAILAAFGRGLCLRIVRVRSLRGAPMSLTTLHVPARHKGVLSPDDPAEIPVMAVIERNGTAPERAEQVITAVPASPLAAEKLGTQEGAPLICMRRLVLDRDRAPVLHQESLYTPDRFEYSLTLSRSQVGPAARWVPIS
jgi:GntR family transcriptional regulator